MSLLSETAVGIDLGTSNSVVFIFKKDAKAPEIVENLETGDRLTPSFIQIEKDKQIIGKVAKTNRNNKKFMNKVLYDMKRFIGRPYDDKELQKDLQSNIWKFTIVKTDENRPNIEVEWNGQKDLYNPEEISGFLLQKLMNFARDRTKEQLTKAVITVPARFNNAQRDSTKSAGRIALLDVIGIINEPTAAALAYGYGVEQNKNATILVFDLGAGTLDLSLVNISNGKFSVIATGGDTHLGGVDFDRAIYKYAKSLLEQKGRVINDVKSNKLLEQCEQAKITLTTSDLATITLDFGDDESEEIEISRTKFEEICSDLFNRIFDIKNGEIGNILEIAKEKKKEIADVLLIGGASRMKKIEEKLYEIFGNKVSKSVNQDEAVAKGAAIYARSILDGKAKDLFDDVTPLSIGILDSDGSMKVLIKRFTKIPCYGVKTFETVFDNQTEADINVYEGEDYQHGENNTFIDHAIFKGLTPKPKGECHVKIRLQIDENGIIEMKAKEKESNNTLKVFLSRPGLLSNKKIDELISKFYQMRDNERISIGNKVESNSFKEYMQDLETKIGNKEIVGETGIRMLNKIKSIKNCIEELGEENIEKSQIEKWRHQLDQM